MSVYIENLKSKGWDNFIVDIGNEFKKIREELNISQSITAVSSSQFFISAEGYSTDNKIGFQDCDSIKNEVKKVREELNINAFSL